MSLKKLSLDALEGGWRLYIVWEDTAYGLFFKKGASRQEIGKELAMLGEELVGAGEWHDALDAGETEEVYFSKWTKGREGYVECGRCGSWYRGRWCWRCGEERGKTDERASSL